MATSSHALVATLAFVISVAAGCASTRASGPAVDDALACRPEALIQLRSDGCDDGHCAVWGVSIYTDGSVVYRGGANVAAVGPRRSKLASANLSTLVSALEKVDFIDTPEHCCDCPDDRDDPKAAKLVIDYRPGGVEKEIVLDERCRAVPDAIRGLAGQIETLTGVATLVAPAPATTRLASDARPSGATTASP